MGEVMEGGVGAQKCAASKTSVRLAEAVAIGMVLKPVGSLSRLGTKIDL